MGFPTDSKSYSVLLLTLIKWIHCPDLHTYQIGNQIAPELA